MNRGLNRLNRERYDKHLAAYLRDLGYKRYVSIEVGKQENVNMLAEMMNYVKEIFG